MRVLTAEMAVVTTIGLLISLATDRDTWRPGTLLQSLRALPGTPFVNATVLERLKAYNRPGFHPDDVDSSALVARWRESSSPSPLPEVLDSLRQVCSVS